MRSLLSLLFAFLLLQPANARPLKADVPPELVPWIPWLESGHPGLHCPRIGAETACIWPGELILDATDSGATFVLDVQVDRDIAVPLPGGEESWPQQVRVAGSPRVVVEAGGVPMVVLTKGQHRVTGEYRWSTRPQSLPVPPIIGRVVLSVDGAPIPWPRFDEEGLQLGAGQTEEQEGERLDLDVSRRITDALPIIVETTIAVRAAGIGREVDLGDVCVPGTHPVALEASLPARFTPDERLIVQVRPGTYTISFTAVHDGPTTRLAAPEPGEPWPSIEYWTVETNDRVRAVNLSGPTGIDAARTTVPVHWRGLPAFAVTSDTPLVFEELRRGEPTPAPNQVNLYRRIWLDLDGGGFTISDTFSGTLNQGWRLNIHESARLGRAVDDDEDQVITVKDGGEGVELRTSTLDLVADSRIESRAIALPAVGWETDVDWLRADLYLPPGWSLLAATGVDDVYTSVLDRWTLFDLFFVLVIALASGKLVGPRWGVVAFAGLALCCHEDGAPQWLWGVALAVVALTRVLPEGGWYRVVVVAKLACILAIAASLLPFSVRQLQVGLFPGLSEPAVQTGGYGSVPEMVPWSSSGDDVQYEKEKEIPARFAKLVAEPGSFGQSYRGREFLSSQIDPGAVVQTGPGVPTWHWNPQPLSWSGAVGSEHQMRLFLLGPWANLILALLRVGLLAALFVRLADWTIPSRRQLAVALLPFFVLAIPTESWATPSSTLLDKLEEQLVAPPACVPNCVTVPVERISVEADILIIDAEVHALVATSWPIPGPWVPSEVRLDGLPTFALARQPDGFLHVRIPAGVHRVVVSGPLPPTDAVALQFGVSPRRVEWRADSWAIDGLHADGTVDKSVQLARLLKGASGFEAQSAENLAPWLEVHRAIDLGIPWRIKTTVSRRGPTEHPISAKIPLVDGEAVTDGTFEARDGLLPIILERDQASVSWISTLEATTQLSLIAPTEVPWNERWTLSCSPIFSCSAEGPAPLKHVHDGAWSPEWQVWPGETVTLFIERPVGVPGQTVTIESAKMWIQSGQRQLTGSLELAIQSSQGGRQIVTLPEGAALQEVHIDRDKRPIQARDGNKLHVSLHPGRQKIKITWRQAESSAFWSTVPAVDLGGPAVNVTTEVRPQHERLIVGLSGPMWGPKPLLWTYILLIGLAAPLLARLPWAPLRTWQWLLLGLGMTQVPTYVPILIVCWFMALGWRKQNPQANAVVFNWVQVGLGFLTVVALLLLCACIFTGLVIPPSMGVAGNESGDHHLAWYVDRVSSAMPQPSVLSLPVWVWRMLVLAWSLWLAASLVEWLPWAWEAATEGGLYRQMGPEEGPPGSEPVIGDL